MEAVTTTTPEPAEARSSPVLNSSSLPPSGVLMISRVMLRAYRRPARADSQNLLAPALPAQWPDASVGTVEEARYPEGQALARPDRPLVQLARNHGEIDRRHGRRQLPAGVGKVSRTPAAAEHQRGGGQFLEIRKLRVGVEHRPHLLDGSREQLPHFRADVGPGR